MAGNRLNLTATAPTDAYLGELAALLRGPRRRRTKILTELRDGLQHAVEGRIVDGARPAEAELQAIAEFGTPREVADAFTAELTTAYARRTVATYIATGPLVGIWWLLLLQPHPWRTGLIALLIAIPVLPLVAIAIMTATTVLSTTGRLIRWLPEARPHRAISGVLAIAGLVLATDTTVIATYLRSDVSWRPLAGVAVAASAFRIVCSAITLRRAGAMRQDVTGHDSPAAGADGHR